MNWGELAVDLDQRGCHREAAWAYELAIRENPHTSELYQNLAVLYFSMTDYGLASALKLPAPYVSACGVRAIEVLDEMETQVGASAEAVFWRHYFNFISLGEEPFVEEAEKLAIHSDIPALYLVEIEPQRYGFAAHRLAVSMRDVQTARGRYIREVLERTLRS
jgi:hypothetical protein